MDAIRSAFSSQKKRKLTKGGVPVGHRHSTTLPPPDSGEASSHAGNLLTFHSSEHVPYPFSAPLRLNTDMKAREQKLKNFVVVTPIYPDFEYFRKYLEIDKELKAYFVTNGLGFVYGDNPGVFEKVVREFAYSFAPKWRVAEIGESRVRFVSEWKFRLGGRDITMSSEDVRCALGLENKEVCLPPSRDLMNELWRMITKSERDYRSGSTATQIKVALWKFIHRLIATCIYLRKDGGRFVNYDDLELMACLYGRINFDPLTCITRTLEEPHLPHFRGHYLSGGHFVSMIAKFVGFSLDLGRALPTIRLGANELLSRGLIKRVKVHGCWVICLNDEEGLPDTASQPRPSVHHEQGEPSTTHHGSSDYDEVLKRLDALSTSTREIADWQNDVGAWQASMTAWQGDMMRGLYTNLGYPGYTSPPRPSFYHAPSADDIPVYDHYPSDEGTGAQFTQVSDDEVEEDEDDDDDTSSDGDEEESEEAQASDRQESPGQYRMVYRRRSHRV